MQPGKSSNFKARRAPLTGALLVLAAAGLGACNPAGTAILIGGSAISYLDTGKTLPDQALSQLMNKDCSTKQLIDDGKLCVDDKSQTTTVAAAAPEYCYRTLASVTCYTRPDPHDPQNIEVAWPNPNGFADGGPQNPGTSVALRAPENKGN